MTALGMNLSSDTQEGIEPISEDDVVDFMPQVEQFRFVEGIEIDSENLDLQNIEAVTGLTSSGLISFPEDIVWGHFRVKRLCQSGHVLTEQDLDLPYFLNLQTNPKTANLYKVGDLWSDEDVQKYKAAVVSITPGVLAIEAGAQLGMVCTGLFALSHQVTREEMDKFIYVFSEVVNWKFLGPAFPGEVYEVESEVLEFDSEHIKCKVKITQISNGVETNIGKGILQGTKMLKSLIEEV